MCDCYKIGGPWIAEDPDCPVHGQEAKLTRKIEMNDFFSSKFNEILKEAETIVNEEGDTVEVVTIQNLRKIFERNY